MSQPPQQAPAMAEGLQTRGAATGTPLHGDALILQVLNRFTYGPRPGDLERVRAMGLSAWFQQQLNPQSIDDSALEKRLTAYPAINMPLNKLMEMYPDNQMIRQAMNGRGSVPRGDAAKAIYANQMERYEDRKAKGKAGGDAKNDDDASLPQTTDAIVAMPPDQRFKALCRLSLEQLKTLRRSMTQDQRDHLTDGMTPQQVEALAAFNGPRGVVEAEAIQVKLLRDVYSERQLNEMMVDFWLNHFNVYMKKSPQAPYYILAYEREAIRPHALGNFENLLKATAMSPAMLNYLDNASSIGPHSNYALHLGNPEFEGRRGQPRPQQQQKSVGLNENYGRELMELHTVGVGGGYTQHDVTEVAKVFTGWTVGKRPGQAAVAQAEFDPEKHEPGDKFVMGHKVKSNGSNEGMEVLHLLANAPQTAHFISLKLAVRFVADDPPPALVDRMAAQFMETHGDIRRVLMTMINSPEFMSSGTYREKVKTPQEYVISAVRAAGADVQSTAGMASAIADLGMPLYGMQTPNGYSMRADPWNNTAALVSRMNFALALSTNRVAGVHTDFTALLGPNAASLTPEEKDKALENAILHVPVSPRTEQLILQQTSKDESERTRNLRQVSVVGGKRDPLKPANGGAMRRPQDPATLDTEAALASGLIFGSPEFQRR
jgi:uncharacterized protein (DUF1800 family)